MTAIAKALDETLQRLLASAAVRVEHLVAEILALAETHEQAPATSAERDAFFADSAVFVDHGPEDWAARHDDVLAQEFER